MTQHILLEKLRGLLKNVPPLEGRGTYGQEQFAWLGKASALISNWDRMESVSFGVACNSMAGNMNRQLNYGTILTSIYKAITSIEESLPRTAEQVFGPGAAYDFFKALSELVSSAEKTLFLVDPYMDAEVFDGYLNALAPGKIVRLLVNKHADNLKVASEKFRTQHASEIDVRKSTKIHDRLIFVDNLECWVLGASIKDAAAKKPTYLAPLSSDVVAAKLSYYEDIWVASFSI